MVGPNGRLHRVMPYFLMYPSFVPHVPSAGELPGVPSVPDSYDVPKAPRPPKPPRPPDAPSRKRNVFFQGNKATQKTNFLSRICRF